jgi:hypothetical protein
VGSRGDGAFGSFEVGHQRQDSETGDFDGLLDDFFRIDHLRQQFGGDE